MVQANRHLLKIIAGHLSHDGGEIIKPKEVTIGYLAQNTGLESNLSIWEEMLTVFEPLQLMEKSLRKLEEQMADPSVFEDNERYERVLKEYDQLQVKFKETGRVSIRSRYSLRAPWIKFSR